MEVGGAAGCMRAAPLRLTEGAAAAVVRCKLCARLSGLHRAMRHGVAQKPAVASALQHNIDQNGYRQIIFLRGRHVSCPPLWHPSSPCLPNQSLTTCLTPPCSVLGQNLDVDLTGVSWSGDHFSGSADIHGFNVHVSGTEVGSSVSGECARSNARRIYGRCNAMLLIVDVFLRFSVLRLSIFTFFSNVTPVAPL